MRIGVIGPLGPDRFADNVGDALTRIGHTVTYLGPTRVQAHQRRLNQMIELGRQAWPSLDERMQRQLGRHAISAECEVVINLDLNLLPETVRHIRRSGAKVAFWFPDHLSNLGRQLMLLAEYDVVFFKDRLLVQRLEAVLGLPVLYLPEACNPRWHRPVCPAATEPYLVLAGNMYPSRLRLLERLIEKGIPLRLYGGGFPRWIGPTKVRDFHTGRTILRDEKAMVFRQAAGVLNNLHPAEMNSVNCRLFEAAGCGAAVLTESRPVLSELFDVGREVLAFTDFDELVDHATRLLNEPGLTAQIGDAAARRAHRDHTYDLRMVAALAALS